MNKFWWPEFVSNWAKSDPTWGFLPSSWVRIIGFPWNRIQCLTSSRGKTHEKKMGDPNLG